MNPIKIESNEVFTAVVRQEAIMPQRFEANLNGSVESFSHRKPEKQSRLTRKDK